MRDCRKCFKEKSLSAFAQYRPEHYHAWCRACVKKTTTRYPPKDDGQLHTIFDKETQ